jgi:AbiV family abortive infection protein
MAMRIDCGPKRADQLFNNLFGDRSPPDSFEVVAAGISASWRNAKRLLDDATCLAEAGRLSSARFLITTAREELAKSYILVDACRLDFSKHRSVLGKLCQAFYGHVAKHAYLEVLEVDGPLVDSMVKARGLWDVAVKRWWPSGDPEYGEPDMPHATHFDREVTLYIDFGDYERRWLIPVDSDQGAHFAVRTYSITRTEELIGLWRKADLGGLCTPKVLEALNSVFKGCYIREDTTREDLERLYRRAATQVASVTRISSDTFMGSPLVRWPLYHFVCGERLG